MKTTQEIEKEKNEKQQSDIDELMGRMFSFIPLEEKSPTSALISAKFCAMVACDYLIEKLPNINDTPPDFRNDVSTYSQYWREVKSKIDKHKPY